MAGLIPEPSGCGPGLSRPADTQQQGVRSVLIRDKRERLLAMRELACEVYEYVCADEWDAEMFLRLQRTAQKLADLAGSMATERGGR